MAKAIDCAVMVKNVVGFNELMKDLRRSVSVVEWHAARMRRTVCIFVADISSPSLVQVKECI